MFQQTNTSRELIKNELLSKREGVIEIRSIMTPNHTRRVVPRYDKAIAWYKGVDRISKDLMESGKPYVDPANPNNPLSSIILKHNMKFDLSNETDYLIFKWLSETDALAMSREECETGGSIMQTFYVYNKFIETKKTASKFQIKDDAIISLNKLTPDELYQTSRLMGFKMEKNEPDEVRLFIRELFEDSKKGFEAAKLFLSVIHDNNRSIKILAHKLLDKSVISTNSKGEYKYKEHFIGFSFDALVAWMYAPENQDLLSVILEEAGEAPLPKRGNKK
jgi:hypothetical protein